jgi:hypothetical protein
MLTRLSTIPAADSRRRGWPAAVVHSKLCLEQDSA